MDNEGELALDAGNMLVSIARQSVERSVRERTQFLPDLIKVQPELTQPGSSFVTLVNRGELRGCIGNTSGQWPLAEDVARNAASATHDPRFDQVAVNELADIRLEVTVLTPPRVLPYASYSELLRKLRPGVDGVILANDGRRGVLLPQVWHRVPDPAQFLAIIARKAGIPQPQLISDPPTIVVKIFQVQSFMESGYREPNG